MAIKHLAEAVILQSLEDFWDSSHRKKSMDFFAGEGFSILADIAGMPMVDRLRLLRLLRSSDARWLPTRHSLTVRRTRLAS